MYESPRKTKCLISAGACCEQSAELARFDSLRSPNAAVKSAERNMDEGEWWSSGYRLWPLAPENLNLKRTSSSEQRWQRSARSLDSLAKHRYVLVSYLALCQLYPRRSTGSPSSPDFYRLHATRCCQKSERFDAEMSEVCSGEGGWRGRAPNVQFSARISDLRHVILIALSILHYSTRFKYVICSLHLNLLN